MSFMFWPIDYDDNTAINYPHIPEKTKEKLVFGTVESAKVIAKSVVQFINERNKGCVIAFDGYVSAQFDVLSNLFLQDVRKQGYDVLWYKMEDMYLPTERIDDMLKEYLPKDRECDPVNLFGKVYDGSFADFIDFDKAKAFKKAARSLSRNQVLLLTGYGSAFNAFEDLLDFIAYIDVTPKHAAVRARSGRLVNIGDRAPRPFSEIMRRNYYVDFEITLALRKHLLKNDLIDFYIVGNFENDFILMPGEALSDILLRLSKYPFRCKPVYLEGVWGGEFIRKARNLPKDFKNIAWSYEMIAFEVSVIVDIDGKLVEFPFSTFLQKYPVELMGEKCAKHFGGYFPIRFNYDDTYHGNGNMSIQVHPDEEFIISEFNEKGRQDEAYYVIATGHGARTFIGFREDADPDEFLRLVKQSEKDRSTIDYLKYINYVDSVPGCQVMIPSGTVHASGRNQLVLELGSLTTGAYTFKMYDYIRQDLDGTLRPIHSLYAEKVLKKDRRTKWVKENLVIEPRLVREGEGYRERIIGSTDLIYFETRQIELETEIEMHNNGQFTVLTLVDGEEVLVYDKYNPQRCFRQKFLDIVVVPATISEYVIKNLGYQPVVVHKTALKPGYDSVPNRLSGMPSKVKEECSKND